MTAAAEDNGQALDHAADLDQWARALVATWPPMSAEQVATVARLLGGQGAT